MQSVVHASFLFFHLGFGSGSDAQYCYTAGKLGQAFLQLLFVIVRSGLFHLSFDLFYAAIDGFLLSGTFADGGIFFFHDDLLGTAEIAHGSAIQLASHIFGDQGSTGEDRDVFEHGFATIAKSRGFHGHDVQDATQFVHHEGGQSFAFDVFGDDEHGLAGLGYFLQNGQEVFHHADLLIKEQDERLVKFGNHLVGITYKIRRDIATIKLHTFHLFQAGIDGFGFFDVDHAFISNALHRFGDQFADLRIVIGTDGGDLRDLTIALD